ncbi:hypothetical protein BN871_GG_00020 [Paenibacillus sp. P22]|nr:hypothetical protein BN871_GG_00020 [Paenibacillus sp. P22]
MTDCAVMPSSPLPILQPPGCGRGEALLQLLRQLGAQPGQLTSFGSRNRLHLPHILIELRPFRHQRGGGGRKISYPP